MSKGNTSGARALKKEFSHLAQYGGAYFRLFEELELVQEQLEIIRLEKENIRVELDAELTNRFVINRVLLLIKNLIQYDGSLCLCLVWQLL